MRKALFLSVIALMLSASTAFAHGGGHNFGSWLYEPFTNHFKETWYPATYEGGVLSENLCGNATCAQITSEGHGRHKSKFLRFELKTNAVAGDYTDTEIREEPHNAAIDSGPWTPTENHPVVLTSRVRMDASHNFDGSGGAVGTLGVGLWNNAAGDDGPNPDYDAIVFSWIDDDFTDFFGADGLTGNTAINVAPVAIVRPSSPIDLQDWVDLKLIWSVDGQGQQSVEHFVNGSSIGSYTLPTPIQGLNVVAWQDNQIFDDTFQPQYLVPAENQTFDVDYIKVKQN